MAEDEEPEFRAAVMLNKSDTHKSGSEQSAQRAIDPAVTKLGYSRIFVRYIWRLLCTVINIAALVLLFGLGGALVALPPDQRDVAVNPEILGWSLLVEAGWFGLMFFIYIFPRMIFPRRQM
jgi:hypothetical protein